MELLNGLLEITVKSVTNPEEWLSENHGAIWTAPNKKTGGKEKHIYHLGEKSGEDLIFLSPVASPKRLTVHFSKYSETFSPWMAAARKSEAEPFGLSLQGQNFLNLVYYSEEKPPGFETLFLKVALPEKCLLYAKIDVQPEEKSGKKILRVTAKKTSEEEVPEHLKNLPVDPCY